MPDNHFQTLGVPENADRTRIKSAYRNLSKRHHPDVGGDTRKMQNINNAYETLNNPMKRAAYDQERNKLNQSTNTRQGLPDLSGRTNARPAPANEQEAAAQLAQDQQRARLLSKAGLKKFGKGFVTRRAKLFGHDLLRGWTGFGNQEDSGNETITQKEYKFQDALIRLLLCLPLAMAKDALNMQGTVFDALFTALGGGLSGLGILSSVLTTVLGLSAAVSGLVVGGIGWGYWIFVKVMTTVLGILIWYFTAGQVSNYIGRLKTIATLFRWFSFGAMLLDLLPGPDVLPITTISVLAGIMILLFTQSAGVEEGYIETGFSTYTEGWKKYRDKVEAEANGNNT